MKKTFNRFLLFTVLTLAYVASALAVQTPLNTAERFVIMDFETTALHDKPWFLAQPIGDINLFVQPKKDSGVNKLSLAVGQGRNGSNAMLVESTTASMGLPGFWVIKAENKGSVQRPKDKQGYILPSGKKANRLEFWLRFEQGFRANKTTALPPSYPNHQNLHVGTYQFDPAKIDGSTGVVESDGWHFYHQVYLRHDKAGSGWIHVVVNQQPQHQRSISSMLPNNPTSPAGNYWELLTRLYVDLHPYYSDPEKAYPVKMWVDDIALSYVPETPDLDIHFLGYTGKVNVIKGKTKVFPLTIENKTSAKVCGKLSVNMPYWFNPALTDTNNVPVDTAYCLPANTVQNLNYTINPKTTRKIGERSSVSLSFVNNNEIFSDSTSANRSLTDSNVEKRWHASTGPHDSNVSSDFLPIVIADNETLPGVVITPPVLPPVTQPPVVIDPPVVVDPVEPIIVIEPIEPVVIIEPTEPAIPEPVLVDTSITRAEVIAYLKIKEKILIQLLGL